METVAEHRVVQVDTVPTGLYTRPVSNQDQTLSLTHTDTAEKRRLVPGLVLVWTPEGPSFIPRPVGEGLLIGRGSNAGFDLGDAKISRRHCTVHRDGAHWLVTDEGSHNGTRVDGVDITGTVARSRIAVIRIGHCLFLPTENMLEIEGGGVENVGGLIIGPRLRSVQQEIRHKGRLAESLHISGESGVGKENAARLLHDGPATKFVAINCAEIPSGILERTLFGSRKGAFTGAEDRVGLLQTADGGTLFLDEIGELPLDVQAKLLRVLEQREVMPLGATRPVRVDFRLCSATHKNLALEVAAGRFRVDLYHRVAHPNVRIPPLRERPEEMSWLIHESLRNFGASAHSSLVEACLLRSWPGNIRELLGELRSAMGMASEAQRMIVEARDLSPMAGLPFVGDADETREDAPPDVPNADDASGGDVVPARRWVTAMEHADSLRDALGRARGNVSEAARLLGTHRTTVIRWMKVLGLDAAKFQ